MVFGNGLKLLLLINARRAHDNEKQQQKKEEEERERREGIIKGTYTGRLRQKETGGRRRWIHTELEIDRRFSRPKNDICLIF